MFKTKRYLLSLFMTFILLAASTPVFAASTPDISRVAVKCQYLSNLGKTIDMNLTEYIYSNDFSLTKKTDGSWLVTYNVPQVNGYTRLKIKGVATVASNFSGEVAVQELYKQVSSNTAVDVTSVKNGWYLNDSNWYFSSNGVTLTKSWRQDSSGKWFYLSATGAMLVNGWAQDSSSKWFYLGKNGAMVTSNWAKDSSSRWFYLGKDGAMLKNTATPDGFKLGADGAWDGKPAGN